MMRATFEQVLEYLKGGADDPAIEEMLRYDPDGSEKVKQAKLLIALLRRKSESADDDSLSEKFHSTEVQSLRIAESASLQDFGTSQDLIDGYIQPLSYDPVAGIAELVESAAGHTEDLGTLVIEAAGERLALSFDYGPDGFVAKAPLVFYQASVESLKFTKKPVEKIQIQGSTFNISVSDAIPVSKPLILRVCQATGGSAAEGVNIIFIPDDGPFVNTSTNTKGFAKLPMPDCSGILRLESSVPHILHIKIKK